MRGLLRSETIIVLALAIGLGACASHQGKMRLSDLGSRFWKGTYYLSVKGSTKSIKCRVNPDYKNSEQVPVYYMNEDAEPLFDLDEDIEKIKALKKQCFDRSFE